MERMYCTLQELLNDLKGEGAGNWAESRLMEKIKTASLWIDRHLGRFIPVTETRRYDGSGEADQYVDPVLAVTAVVDDTTTLSSSDYLLYPRNRLWENGPYIRISIDPDAASVFTFTQEKDIVAVTGRFGLYEDSVATGASVASQDDDDTVLTVDNAAQISPGAVLLIGTEQEAVTASGAFSDSTAALDGAIEADDEVITLDDGSLVNAGEVIKIGFEQMFVQDISGNDLLVMRGWNQTRRTSHLDESAVSVLRTFTVTRGANGTTAAAHTSAAISRCLPPEDIRYLCVQMAALMLKKADSGFSGKIGDANSGETFYYSEFPASVINNIKKHYFVPRI